ncbi:MAG: F0F1 ATP synthase subunit A [Chloroflexi bacterium]|nr:F0F1 ATP synthase subunit A [Chloroflexota bacterium]
MLSRGRLVVVLLIALTLVGFVFFRGPTPHITIKPETIFDAGGISFTNTMITSWLVVGFMLIGVFLVTRRWDLVPSGAQNVVEAVVEAFYGIVENVAGEKNGRRFFPVVATIFFFILFSNWLSLMPLFNVIGVVQEEEHGFVMENASVGGLDIAYVGLSSPSSFSGQSIDEEDADAHEQFEQAKEDGKTVGELLPLLRGPNTDINTPMALAIVSMIAVEFWGISTLGLFRYGKKFLNFSSPIAFFVGFLEFISEVVRLLSFTARLFGNMFAGEVVILMFTFMTPLVVVIFYGLEIFVGVIQAFIFAMLTVVFGVMAVTAHDDHESEAEPHTEMTKIEA